MLELLEFILAKILVWALTLSVGTLLIYTLYCLYDSIQIVDGLEGVILKAAFILICIIILLVIAICILNGTAKEILL